MSLWHCRLGHPSSKVSKHVIHFTINETVENIPYEICARLKQHRIPFPISNTCSKNAFDLLHIDLWGPYHTKSISRAQYILAIVDDHIRSVWTFLLSHKTIVVTTLRHFFAMIKTQYSCNVKSVRNDNGTEFMNRECVKLFGELVIIH